MFEDLEAGRRDEDEMEDFRDYDEEAGGEPAKLDEYEDGALEDDDEDDIVAVVTATPVIVTEIVEIVEEVVPKPHPLLSVSLPRRHGRPPHRRRLLRLRRRLWRRKLLLRKRRLKKL